MTNVAFVPKKWIYLAMKHMAVNCVLDGYIRLACFLMHQTRY